MPDEQDQFAHYEAHGRVFEQVVSLFEEARNLLIVYGVATGAIWTALIGNGFRLGLVSILVGYGLHVALSLAWAWFLFGISMTMAQRFLFLRAFGDRFYPGIERMGAAAHSRVSYGAAGPLSKWALGQPRWLYAAIPLVAVACDLFLAAAVAAERPARQSFCEQACLMFFKDNSGQGLDRAKYLLDKGECDPIATFTAPPDAALHVSADPGLTCRRNAP